MDTKFYLLKALQLPLKSYDCAEGFVIRASSAKKARLLASINCGDEGPDFWLNSKKSSCKTISEKGKTCVILKDYHHA